MATSSVSRNRDRLRAGALIALGTAAACALAQTPADELQRMRRAWHDAQGVELKNNTTITLLYKDGQLTATRTVEEERMSLKGVAGMGSEDQVHYSTELMTLGEINAYTLAPGERGYRKIKVENITHKDDIDGPIFHDDSRTATFLYPQVEPGAITHVDYTITYSDPRLVTGHYFGSGEPVEESTLTIITEPGVEVDVRYFNVDPALVEVERDEEKGRRVTRYRMRKLAPFNSETDAPGFRWFLPHLQFMVKGYTHKGRRVELLQGLDGLYDWYWTHIDHARDITPRIRQLADSIVVKGAPERENVKRIYQWVQKNISYIAFEAGMQGLVPAAADEVLAARYGDCKGMSCLLVNLLDAAGYPASLTWVGSRAIPYSHDSIPSPATDDHMIVVYDPEGDWIVLDGTDSEVPFGMPSSFIQGKSMLIGIDSTRYLVRNAPIMPASANVTTDSSRVRIEGNALKGTSATRYAGYARGDMAGLVRRVKPERHAELMRAILERGNNKFTIDTFDVAGLDDRDDDLRIGSRFNIGDMVQQGKGELYVNLNLHHPWAERNYKAGRTVAVENDYANTHRSITELELPAGTSVGWLPATATFTDPRFSYRIAYEAVSAGIGSPALVRCTAEFTENNLLLHADDITAWRDMMKQLRTELDRSIVLKTP